MPPVALQLNISDISEEVATFAKHKNPQVKEQTLRFLIRSLSTTKMPPSVKTDLKPLSDCLMAGLEDSSEPVRAAAAEGLGTLRRILGERALAPLWASLDDVRKAKVMDYEAKAIVQCGPTSRITAKAALPSAKSETTASSAPVSTERTQGTAPDISKMPPRLAAAMRAVSPSRYPALAEATGKADVRLCWDLLFRKWLQLGIQTLLHPELQTHPSARMRIRKTPLLTPAPRFTRRRDRSQP